MRAFKIVLLVLLSLVLLFSAAVSLPFTRAEESLDSPPPAAISLLFREADRILVVTCMRVTGLDRGDPTARFRVDEVIDGAAEEGETLSLSCEALAGWKYLLYLKDGTDGTELLTSAPLPVDSESITYENEVVSLASIAQDIERQRKILVIPSGSYYYGSLEGLAPACDEIVIGRVLSVSEPTDTVCRSAAKGESTSSTMSIVYLRVRVENGFYGGLSYGDKLDIAIAPYNAIPILNATDLSPMTADAPPVLTPEIGSAYIFFLVRSEDRKNERYFPVNPYEGSVLLVGSSVIHPYFNDALKGLDDLAGFARRLREITDPDAAY